MPLGSRAAGEVGHGGPLFGLSPLAPPLSLAPNQNEGLVINTGARRRRRDSKPALEPQPAARELWTGCVTSLSSRRSEQPFRGVVMPTEMG